MTSKIKVDNIENQCGGAVVTKCGGTTTISGSVVKSNAIQASDGGNLVSQCGTTITLGASGDTINLASGASQSGFGREGSVDWQTGSIKTGTFTAVNGEGYFANTAGGAFTMNLPAGSAGAIVSVQDYNNTFDSNALTVDANGSEKINGGAGGEPITLDTEGRGVTFVYIDATVGWRSVQDNDFTKKGTNAAFVAATGGNTTATSPCGDYKIHTFTGPGTFCVSSAGNVAGNNEVEYIVVAAGGGAGTDRGAGGGAGGYRFASPSLAPATYPAKPLAAPAAITATVASFPITVGSGGAGGGPSAQGTSGSVSTFSNITSAGGGGGGGPSAPKVAGLPGGSGGGGTCSPGTQPNAGGSGNTPPVSPPQGNDGGANTGGEITAGGGGGAIAAGTLGGPGSRGDGGNGAGVPNAFGTSGQNCGSFYYFSGGGGGGGGDQLIPFSPNRANGGLGGGGLGGTSNNSTNLNGANGTINTGGGGGGGGNNNASAAGGSGIVIIRYKFQ